MTCLRRQEARWRDTTGPACHDTRWAALSRRDEPAMGVRSKSFITNPLKNLNPIRLVVPINLGGLGLYERRSSLF